MVDNRLIINHLQERKTEPRPLIEVTVYQSYCKRTKSLYHTLALCKKHWFAYHCLSFSIRYKHTKVFGVLGHFVHLYLINNIGYLRYFILPC